MSQQIQRSLLSHFRVNVHPDAPDDVMVLMVGRSASVITAGHRASGKVGKVYVYVWDDEQWTPDGVKLIGLRQTSPAPPHSEDA